MKACQIIDLQSDYDEQILPLNVSSPMCIYTDFSLVKELIDDDSLWWWLAPPDFFLKLFDLMFELFGFLHSWSNLPMMMMMMQLITHLLLFSRKK